MKKKDEERAASGTKQEERMEADENQAAEDHAAEDHAAEKQIIKALEAKLEESNDRFLRLFSEFDNYRKRTNKERLELAKTASSDVITALLPVLDDLERACQVESQSGEGAKPDDGLVLILNKFKAILRQKGVEEIPSIGEAFDTDLHEAITHVPASGKDQKGKVVDEVQKGYKLNGKVIRFSRVVVAS